MGPCPQHPESWDLGRQTGGGLCPLRVMVLWVRGAGAGLRPHCRAGSWRGSSERWWEQGSLQADPSLSGQSGLHAEGPAPSLSTPPAMEDRHVQAGEGVRRAVLGSHAVTQKVPVALAGCTVHPPRRGRGPLAASAVFLSVEELPGGPASRVCTGLPVHTHVQPETPPSPATATASAHTPATHPSGDLGTQTQTAVFCSRVPHPHSKSQGALNASWGPLAGTHWPPACPGPGPRAVCCSFCPAAAPCAGVRLHRGLARAAPCQPLGLVKGPSAPRLGVLAP